jgi:hypothetical protein
MLHAGAIQRVAVMRSVQDTLGPIEKDANARARQGLHRGAHVTQQRFDVAPVDVATDRIVEDRADQLLMLVAHWNYFQSRYVQPVPTLVYIGTRIT